MDRDVLAWLVDISTVVVGIGAVGAVVFSVNALKSERQRSERTWHQQIALEHHARIYEASASLIAAGVAFTRDAESLVVSQRGQEDSYVPGQLDKEVAVLAAYDRAISALNYLYFLIPGGAHGEDILKDLLLVAESLAAVRPRSHRLAGDADLNSMLDGTGLRNEVEMLVDTDSLHPDDPVGRVRFVREILERYLRGRIALFVPPPPLATLSS